MTIPISSGASVSAAPEFVSDALLPKSQNVDKQRLLPGNATEILLHKVIHNKSPLVSSGRPLTESSNWDFSPDRERVLHRFRASKLSALTPNHFLGAANGWLACQSKSHTVTFPCSIDKSPLEEDVDDDASLFFSPILSSTDDSTVFLPPVEDLDADQWDIDDLTGPDTRDETTTVACEEAPSARGYFIPTNEPNPDEWDYDTLV